MDRTHIPHTCGVYLMRDVSGEIIYIGKAIDLAKRVAQYFNPGKEDYKNSALTPLIRSIDYIPCVSEREALLLERELIREHQPFFNSMWKDDKSYPYVKITLGEDFPRVIMTRKKINDGGLYFGPFPKSSPIKSLLRYLWRQQLFPLRPCRWDFDREKPLEPRKINSCLYYHTGQCPAPCANKISIEDYRAIAARAALFFRGEYGQLTQELEKEMKEASAKMLYEKALILRDNLTAISQMGERVRLHEVKREDVTKPLENSRAVTDLKIALNLPHPPFHVECFDISHFQGNATVASMVCFKGGLPYRSHYRKFKIRETVGVDDFKSMSEVVFRRYTRLKESKENLPDLILIDGGKGQLSAALESLEKLKLKIPIASLAKRLEEVFIPEQPESILLERSRPALQLLQRLRDEAHRFAITYHRLLRNKQLLGPAISNPLAPPSDIQSF